MLAVGGDAPYCNEKAANLTLCLRVGFVLFRLLAIRGVVSPGHSRCDTPDSQKARSAIRCIKTGTEAELQPLRLTPCQKARSTIRCIKTLIDTRGECHTQRQKARSTIRCIKTCRRIHVGRFGRSSECTERHKVHLDSGVSVTVFRPFQVRKRGGP